MTILFLSKEAGMQFDQQSYKIVGPHGTLSVAAEDEIARKLAMLIEGECEGVGRSEASRKFGYTRQRYSQIFHAYQEHGSAALASRPRGPKRNYRRTDELVRQVIRHRFLDAEASADVIAQKLRQTDFSISTRSVERVIADYGLQKKTLQVPASKRSAGND
jgi:transposase